MNSSKGILSIIMLGFLVFAIDGAALAQGSGERVRLKEPRIKPLAESERNTEQQALLNRIKGRMINLYPTIANNPKLADKFLTFGGYLLGESTLPPRDREILILRTGWLCQSEYEFGQHTLVGKRQGLTEEEIERITKGPRASGWDPFDATLLRAADELHADAFITDATWNALAKRYNQQQLMDVVATVGYYHLVSMSLNSFGVQLEQGVPGFPQGKEK